MLQAAVEAMNDDREYVDEKSPIIRRYEDAKSE